MRGKDCVDQLSDELLELVPLDSQPHEDKAKVLTLWAEEVQRRRAELRSGSTTAVPWTEVRIRLNAL